MKRTIKTLVAAGVVGSTAVLAGAYFGVVNVGADDPHFPAVHAFLTMARDRSIEVRSRDIEVPNLDDQALIRAGAGNYNSMCIGCHLAPGVAETELSQSLYPAPPNLAKIGVDGNPSAAFWVIKHGIKATGMPAWGKSMGDEYIWGMVALSTNCRRWMPSNTKHSSHPVAAISTVVGKRRCITKKDSTATTSLAIMTIVAVAMTIMDQVMLESLVITMPRLRIARVAPHLRQVTIRI